MLVLGSMVRMKLTLTFFFDPRQSHNKWEDKNSEATIRIAMLQGLSSSPGFNHWLAKRVCSFSFTISAPLLLLSATYSNNKVHFFSRNSHRQTQIRHTSFPTLTILSDDARLFLLDICSSKDSHSAHMSLESDVTLLTSGEASDASTLGYGGKPSQEKRHLY